jgi:hypothetical protein
MRPAAWPSRDARRCCCAALGARTSGAHEAVARPDDDTAKRVRRPSRWRQCARKYLLLGSIMPVVVVVGAGSGSTLLPTTRSTACGVSRARSQRYRRPSARPRSRELWPKTSLLVGGVDTRSEVPTTGRQAKSSEHGRADTLMMVHLMADGCRAYVVGDICGLDPARLLGSDPRLRPWTRRTGPITLAAPPWPSAPSSN